MVCLNKNCICLDIFLSSSYLQGCCKILGMVQAEEEYEQDSTVMEWDRYVSKAQATGKSNWYQVPFDGSIIEDTNICESLLNHQLCTKGMQLAIGIGAMHLKCIQHYCKCTRIVPEHKLKGAV